MIKAEDQFTDREIATARFLDSLVNEKTIEKLLKSDFYNNFYTGVTPIVDNNQEVPTCKINLK